MQIELFREFVVLAEELNYHAAARRLNITQSTLSKHIATLEREYGSMLFSRDRSGVALTASGSVLLECAKSISTEYERSRLLMTPRERKTLFIGGELDNPTAYPIVSKAVGVFMRKNSEYVPHFVASPSLAVEVVSGSLKRGEIDCAVFSVDKRALSDLPDAEKFVSRSLFQSPLMAIMAPTNALAGRKELHIADFAGCTLMQLVGPRYSPAWKLLERQLRSARVPFTTTPFAAHTSYDFMGVDLLSSILLMPVTSGIPGEDLLGGSVAVPVVREEFSLEMSMLYLRENPAADKIEELATALEQAYREQWDEL